MYDNMQSNLSLIFSSLIVYSIKQLQHFWYNNSLVDTSYSAPRFVKWKLFALVRQVEKISGFEIFFNYTLNALNQCSTTSNINSTRPRYSTIYTQSRYTFSNTRKIPFALLRSLFLTRENTPRLTKKASLVHRLLMVELQMRKLVRTHTPKRGGENSNWINDQYTKWMLTRQWVVRINWKRIEKEKKKSKIESINNLNTYN